MNETQKSATELMYITEKYRKYSFSDLYQYQYWNNLPPEVKACLAGDKEAILIFIKYGMDFNNRMTIPHEGSKTILQDALYIWGNKDYRIIGLDKVNRAEMFMFLVKNGANVDLCTDGLCTAIKALRSYGDEGVSAIKLAIQRRANLKNCLASALRIENDYRDYAAKVIQLLLDAGATL